MRSASPEAALAARRDRLRTEVEDLRAKWPAYPRRHLYVLMVVTAIDASDRTMLSTVFEDVKRAFDISDTQLGLLTSAFLVFATVSAVPFGYLADRMSRVKLIALGFIPWSLAMFWSAGAGTFAMLLGSRVFLGSIEATNGPATPALLGDYYPVAQRSRVYGVFAIGTQLGSILGFAVGGALATAFGWREAFVVFGVAGLATGFAVTRLLPEPARGLPDALHRAEGELTALDAAIEAGDATDLDEIAPTPHVDLRHLTTWQAMARVLSVRTMWVMAVSQTVSLFFTASLAVWLPTYFRRYYGLSAAAAGGLLSVLTLFLIAAIVVGSRRGDRALVQGGPQRRVVIIAACLLGQVVAWFGLFSVDSLPFGIACIAVVAVFTGFPIGITQAVLLDIFAAHLRGRAFGIQTVLRVVATAAAPVVFGVLSDFYGLRSAWLYTLPALPVAAAITMLAVRTYPVDMAAAHAETLRQHRLERREALEHAAAEPPTPPPPTAPPPPDVVELPDYQPPPYEPAPSLYDRARSLARAVTSTPRRASVATLCGVAAIALVLSAWPVHVEAVDQRGPLTAECGLDVVVFGHPDATAERACRDAVGGRAAVATIALAALAVGLVGLVQILLARSRAHEAGPGRLAGLWAEVWARPHRAVLAGATVVAAVVVAVTSRSVPTEVAADGGTLSVRCGVDTVLLGHAIEPVERACRDTLTTEAAVFVPAVLVLVVGLVGLLRLLAGVARHPLGVALVVAGGLAVLCGMVALRPVTVEVEGAQGDSMLVSCGIDAAVSGHAIESVEEACRDEVGSNAAGLAGAVLVLVAAAGGLRQISRAPLVPGVEVT